MAQNVRSERTAPDNFYSGVFLDMIAYLEPYQFSPLILVSFAVVLGIYLRGLWRAAQVGLETGWVKPFSFLLGLLLCYFVMHTQYDYYAQYLFFAHRLQHLVLHHLGPFLMALSFPAEVLALGLPTAMLAGLPRVRKHPVVRWPYLVLQNPVVAPVLFVGLIFFWLQPEIHFDAMLSTPLYHLMNWSMLLDGLLFWFLALDFREEGRWGYGTRIAMLVVVTFPQIVLGAYITFARGELFDVYSVCGRAWAIDPARDQLIGGIITWIPASMMSVIGVLVLLRFYMKKRRAEKLEESQQPA